MGGQLGLPRLGGDGRCDDGGAVAVAGVVLHDEHRTHAALLTAHHTAGGQVVQDLLVSCAGIMKSLSNTLDLMRSLPVEVDSRNKF